MVKLFVLGDFHGELPEKIVNRIRKENPDFILSSGDFCGSERMGTLFFKYFYGREDEDIPDKIKREYAKLESTTFKSGVNVIRRLKQLKIPILAIHGNWDPTPYPYDIGGKKNETDKESFKKLEGNFFRLIDFSVIEQKDFIIVGGGSSTSPGVPTFKKLRKNIAECKSYSEVADAWLKFLRAKREYLRRKIVYNRLFSRAKKIANGRKIIFLTHNCPYKTKLDIVHGKHSHKPVSGKHMGSYLERKIIEKFQPDLVLCGHIHEGFGEDRIRKSKIINHGSILDGKFIILEM